MLAPPQAPGSPVTFAFPATSPIAPPIRHAFRLHGPMQLPRLMRDSLESYLSALTVHSQGVGLAVNPDRLVFTCDGVPIICADKSDDAKRSTVGPTAFQKCH
ncbi:hypothetical protein R69608_06211 [Paraburkholderia nemoris]|nr:hypothetical protein R69608_06211 [Paraburkholderia nemoris]